MESDITAPVEGDTPAVPEVPAVDPAVTGPSDPNAPEETPAVPVAETPVAPVDEPAPVEVSPAAVAPDAAVPVSDGPILKADSSHGALALLLAEGGLITSELLDQIEARESVGDIKYLVAFCKQLLGSQA